MEKAQKRSQRARRGPWEKVALMSKKRTMHAVGKRKAFRPLYLKPVEG
jgi:hypothetical protein